MTEEYYYTEPPIEIKEYCDQCGEGEREHWFRGQWLCEKCLEQETYNEQLIEMYKQKEGRYAI